MRRLLALAAGLALLLPASALAAKPRAVASSARAVRAADGARTFTVAVHGRASAVVICDADPIVCRVAERRHGGRWRAVLPSGTGVGSVAAPGGFPPGQAPVTGSGPAFRIVVYAFQGPRSTRRAFVGRYLDA